ncbi:hypothetical protein L1987_42810 [Smallanthus sonchifolius]|uniref:Uncharacterized protein n=1 Tax=Smallanthus sonchifolius TaxID=185202 RepID=A0ACB9GJX1_9ASTR|nr:hypothetical protein L1987_42810 [Smallanthus sonchifolius]
MMTQLLGETAPTKELLSIANKTTFLGRLCFSGDSPIGDPQTKISTLKARITHIQRRILDTKFPNSNDGFGSVDIEGQRGTALVRRRIAALMRIRKCYRCVHMHLDARNCLGHGMLLDGS